MIPAFVINMDRNPDRLRYMRAQFGALGLDFTRIEGVDGRQLPDGASGAAPYANLGPGQVGCFESHRKAWAAVVKRNLPCGIVLEDDVAVAADFGALSFEDDFLAKTDFVKIDTRKWPIVLGTETRPSGTDRPIRRLVGGELSASGYVVTRRGAERALARSRNYVVPVDRFLFHVGSPSFHRRTIWKLCPAIVTQLKYFMDEDALHEDLYSGIGMELRAQGATEAPPREGWRLRLRRGTDRGRRAILQRIKGPAGDTVKETVVFETQDGSHIQAGLEAMGRPDAPAG